MSSSKCRVAILGSTKGTDLAYILKAFKKEDTRLENIEISFVLSNKENSGILQKARDANIKDIFINPLNYTNSTGLDKKAFDQKISEYLDEFNVDLIILIGYMKLMSCWFVETYKNRIMNIHPSLLPAFSGKINKTVHQSVLDRGCKLTGATLMFIDSGADTGPIISQEIVRVEKEDNVESLKSKVQELEGEMLIDGMKLYADGKISVNDNNIVEILN